MLLVSSYSIFMERRIPRWMAQTSLKCNEVIVNRVPTLAAIVAAEIIASGTKIPKYPNWLLVNVANQKLNCIVADTWYSKSRGSFIEEHFEIRPVYKALYDPKVVYAYPYQDYDVIQKEKVKTFPNEQKRLSCKRRLFD